MAPDEHVEERALPGTVGTNEAAHLAVIEAQRHTVDCAKAVERLRQIIDAQ
jgi:hypothetical protein